MREPKDSIAIPGAFLFPLQQTKIVSNKEYISAWTLIEVSIRNFSLILLAELSQNGTEGPFVHYFTDGN
jgi:hypothetical protein